MLLWPKIKPHLKKGDALYFSHGFGMVYNDQTGIAPPDYVDVILVAPKGSGTSVRANFLAGSGINSSYAIVAALQATRINPCRADKSRLAAVEPPDH